MFNYCQDLLACRLRRGKREGGGRRKGEGGMRGRRGGWDKAKG